MLNKNDAEGFRLVAEEAFKQRWEEVLPYMERRFPGMSFELVTNRHPYVMVIHHPQGRLEVQKWLNGTARFTARTREQIRQAA